MTHKKLTFEMQKRIEKWKRLELSKLSDEDFKQEIKKSIVTLDKFFNRYMWDGKENRKSRHINRT